MNSVHTGTSARSAPAGAGIWRCRDTVLRTRARPLVMGILNVTPDSFSDGGRHADAGAALEHALELLAQGADIIDVGGESTRPGADPVDAAEEIRRTEPVIRRLAAAAPQSVISIDTRKAATARHALDAGARIVNDISALDDPEMAETVRAASAGVILMHKQGEPATMQACPHYKDVLSEVAAFLRQRLERAVAAGIERERIALDPGIGFGKTLAHNLALLSDTRPLSVEDRPLVIGLSRKSFLGQLCGGRPPGERLAAGLAATAWTVWRGAGIIRTHDVRPTREAIDVIMALQAAGG